jgi:hypothetical protein
MSLPFRRDLIPPFSLFYPEDRSIRYSYNMNYTKGQAVILIVTAVSEEPDASILAPLT